MARKNSVGGSLGAGLLVLVAGLLVKHAEAGELARCSTSFGRFGQVVDPNVASSCSTAQSFSDAATTAIWGGAIGLAILVGGLIIGVIVAEVGVSNQKTKAVVAAGQDRAVNPAPPPTPDPPPAASRATPGDSGLPTRTRRSECGHVLRPGARFCTVCGSRAPGVTRPRLASAAPAIDISRPRPASPAPVSAVPALALSDPRPGRHAGAPVPAPPPGHPDVLDSPGRSGRHRVHPVEMGLRPGPAARG